MTAKLIGMGVSVDAGCRECDWYRCGEPFAPTGPMEREVREHNDAHHSEEEL
ncbi:hypothetical protein [Tsukamurella soli]|uniref:DUF1059 domain-containing protein n=1 Tax=Tsukamurella soli TaxID=644556 RepID=A0ABP8JIY5_9ACTN